MKDYLNQLNPSQREAVESTEGPLMVIAGAGSGKTRVLTYRIAHLMEKGVDSFSILSLTFTNKAAKEMKERIAKIVGTSDAKNLWMGTFHSVFARILRSEAHLLGFPSNFTIYDPQDTRSLISKIIKEKQLDKDVYKPKQVLSRISQFKNNLITVKVYNNNVELQEQDATALKPKMGEIYKTYVERCFKAGAMDFDDLLLRTNELLARFPEVLNKYQNRFKYILVDEYQDTNHSQYLIVKALASRFENICVVGDDAQSIYAFRGANIKNILNFQKDYLDAKMIRLEQNYRSTKHIVQAANNVIAKNKKQLQKNVWTSNEEGELISVFRAVSDGEEASYVTSRIFDLKMNHQAKDKDIAILYRTNAQSRSMEEALRKKNISYRIYGGLSFYQRKEIKDIVAYLRLIVNKNDEEALLRIINYPTRGIGQVTLNKLIVTANDFNVSIYDVLEDAQKYQVKITASTQNKLTNFHTLIESFKVKLKENNAFELVDFVAKNSGLVRSLKEDTTLEGVSKYENVQELLNSVKGYTEEQQELAEGNPSVDGFLENIALATDADQDKGNDDEKVSLMTIHLSKGLEYPYVFIVGLEENLFPSMMSLNSRADLEEERRLFYVALTRAEKKAYLTYAQTRYRWGKLVDAEMSRFIEEIDEEHLDLPSYNQNRFVRSSLDASIFGDTNSKYSSSSGRGFATNKKQLVQAVPKNVGKLKKISEIKNKTSETSLSLELNVNDRVEHGRFGLGIVLKIEGDDNDTKATIKFGQSGVKKLLLKFAKLKKLN